MIQRLNEDAFPGKESLAPYQRPNDRFVMVPSADDSGGVIRKLSLRQHRRNFTVAVTAFTIGILAIVCSSDWSKEFLVPGPLSSHHAPLVASEGGERCATCHANANSSLTGWISSVFVSGKHAGVSQSQLCMKCHEQSLASEFFLNPHNADPVELAKLTDHHGAAKFHAGAILPSPVNDQNRIACSVCHQEHHGGKGLTTLTDAQCQTCHGKSFHSFERGHPEFVSYPQQRRARIAFDHASHAGKHFIDKQSEFSCSQCHVDDPFQNVKRLASFEQSCAACHNQQILDSGSQGLALIALPMLDMTAIELAGLNVGGWPLAATGDFDGEIPPMMRLMLVADPLAKEVFHRHGPDFEFFDFDATKNSDVNDAVTLVWAIKRLLFELAVDGPQAVRARLQDGLGFEISDKQLQRIITNLDGPIFQNAANSWLPQLAIEINRSKLSAATPRSMPKEQFIGLSIENGLITKTKIAWKPSRNDVVLNWSDDGERLAVNPLKELMSGERPIVDASLVNAPIDGNGETSHSPESSHDLKTVDSGVGVIDEAAVEVEQISPFEVVASNSATYPPGSWTTNGTGFVTSGWYRNDQNFRISYKPGGHADGCLQSWIELVTRADDAHSRLETKQLFEKTISMTGVGLCRTCHTVDQRPDRSFAVNWVAEYREPSIRSFTHFAHGPHLLQPELQDCSHCHQLDPTRSNAASFLSEDANQVVSNFLPTTKSDCVSCHQRSRTNSGCTQCHNYHVGSRVIGSR